MKNFTLEMGGTIWKDKNQVNEFINKIGNLTANGGGDCPEYALEGMFEAIRKDPEYGSPLFVFTDASPKDGTVETVEQLIGLAQFCGVTINFFTEESCDNPPSSTFEVYRQLQSKTGGNYLRIQHTELKSLANFTDTELGRRSLVLNAYKLTMRYNCRHALHSFQFTVHQRVLIAWSSTQKCSIHSVLYKIRVIVSTIEKSS